jgi:hypothetical protein
MPESGKLTDEAQEQIREAIRIVREDRFEKYVRNRHAGNPDPPEKKDDGKTGPPAPPAKPENEGTGDEPKRRGIWWREDDDEEGKDDGTKN